MIKKLSVAQVPTPSKNKDKKNREQKDGRRDDKKKNIKLNKAITKNSTIETATHVYYVVSKLGSGGFGDVYEVTRKSDKLICAVKIEFMQNSTDRRLKKEYEIYREITKAKLRAAPNSKHLMEVIDYGECKDVATFMFMPLCGKSLDSVLKHKIPTLETALNMASQALQAIQNFHSFMHIHRDIKPANFVLGTSPHDHLLFLIDFGMAVRYCIDQEKMPKTSTYDFIGLPQTRKDDVESWFYVILEFFSPKILPWSGEKNNKLVNSMKDQLFTEEPKEAFSKLPASFVQIAAAINGTKTLSAPAYDYIHKAMAEVAINHSYWLNGPLRFNSPEVEEYNLY